MNYNSLIGADFKNATTGKGVKHYVPAYALVATALIGILIVSVVLAQSNQTSPAASNLSAAEGIPTVATQEQASDDYQTTSLQLKPVTELSQSQILALLESNKNNQEPILINESIDELETISTEVIAEESDVTVVVKKGDTLSSIFSKLDIHDDYQTTSLQLKPVTELSQSQILALLESNKNNQEPILINESIDELETISTEVIAEESDVTVVVKKGDTLSSIFSKLDIHNELTKILNLGKQAKPFKKIYPGQKIHFTFGNYGIDKLELEKSITKSLLLYRDHDSFIVEESNRELDRISQVATGTIDQSLFLAGQDAGMSDRLIMGLAGIFGWDIDFALDIREGDSFTVFYEELLLEGEKVGDGNIIAAEFVNNKHTYRAYRYTDNNNKTEYYSPDGKSMRKPFMRTPVDLARISSHFNLKRKHPILNKIRAHKGVDYAASVGTAIKATGDGKVIHRGKKGGYGNTVILRHGNTYTTLYAHMSKYARKTSVGSRVKQGQTIGYIGSTGLATGPHLHYEFRVYGVHRNPLKVKLPSAKPLPDTEMDRFQVSIQPMIVQLDAYTQNALVMRDL